MPGWALVVALFALVASGCVRRSDPYGHVPRVDARRLRNLHHIASRELACPAAVLQAQALTDRVWQVSGCGQVREFAIMARGRRRGAQWRPLEPIGRRAVVEMACPPQMLSITAPQPLERELVGCGRRATYHVVCGDIDCAWAMSAHSGAWTEGAAATAPASAAVVVVADPGRAPVGVAPEVDGALRAAIDAQRDALLACAGGQAPLAVIARWGAGGAVEIALGAPHAGSAAEPCARAAVGALQVTTGAPGEIIHVVR